MTRLGVITRLSGFKESFILLYKKVSHSIAGITCILNLLKQVNNGVKDAFLVFEWKGNSWRVTLWDKLLFQ